MRYILLTKHEGYTGRTPTHTIDTYSKYYIDTKVLCTNWVKLALFTPDTKATFFQKGPKQACG